MTASWFSAFNGLLSGAKIRWSLLIRGTAGRSQLKRLIEIAENRARILTKTVYRNGAMMNER